MLAVGVKTRELEKMRAKLDAHEHRNLSMVSKYFFAQQSDIPVPETFSLIHRTYPLCFTVRHAQSLPVSSPRPGGVS